MILGNVLMLGVAALAASATLRPKFRHNRGWRATVTPLASIIGSGFLIVGPILGHAAGNWAWLAMVGLCAAAYLFGSAIRYNIAFVEPVLEKKPPGAVIALERMSDLALSIAYFISVTYYLNLFAAFGLRAVGLSDPLATRLVASGVIAAVGIWGALRGLRALEGIEEFAVGVKLGLIAGLCAALLATALLAVGHGDFSLTMLEHTTGRHEVAILLGLIILVQGFETSRYLGDAYDRATRIRTMRNAQLLSSAIYIVFILLITPYFSDDVPTEGSETAIIDMLAHLGVLTGPLIIVVALASQLSAAVADLSGAGGLISSSSGRRVAVPAAYMFTALVAVSITWIANIYEIIVYASKAFVFYYGLQSVQAAWAAAATDRRDWPKVALFVIASLLAVTVVMFGVPADS